jgi:hypothetical protein
MEPWLNLLEETKMHFSEGARSVRAHTNNQTFIITVADATHYYVTTEEPGFPKTKASTLDQYFKDVFGIEARY